MAVLLADHLTVALVALALDALIGWPDALYRRIGHPVTWIGRLITLLDRRCNQGPQRVLRGFLASSAVILTAALPAILLAYWLTGLSYGPVLLGGLAWPLVAARSLDEHVRAVAIPLAAGEIASAKQAAAMIVGRDLHDDPQPIARAALESLAENASDGVIAPLLWTVIAGLPGIAAYKAINTLDSMIGHLNTRHGEFGRFAARLDDVVNLPASRLTGLLMAVAGASGKALRVIRQDAGKHRSPNAGWPEGAMAGALQVRLSGPRSYGGVITDEPWMNATDPDPDAGDLLAGLTLYRRSVAGMFILMLLGRMLLA